MKILYGTKIRIIALLAITISISFVTTMPAYSAMDDKSDRLSNDQAGIFSPGYINAAKQHTYDIINQESTPKSFMENAIDYVKNKLSKKVDEASADKPVPELKKKSSAASEGALQKTTMTVSVENMINVTPDAPTPGLTIGSGTSKIYDTPIWQIINGKKFLTPGKLLGEVIDGKRYIYAGFTDVGKSTIQDAMSIAQAGDIIAVKAGTYNAAIITLKDGVSLYGGYSENGTRNIANTPTIINGFITATNIYNPVEINGFTINVLNGYSTCIYASNAKLTISNNTLNSSAAFLGVYGISGNNISGLTVKNNKFNNFTWGIYLGISSYGSSSGNDFNSSAGVLLYNLENHFSSTGDYFARSPTYGIAIVGYGAPNFYFADPDNYTSGQPQTISMTSPSLKPHTTSGGTPPVTTVNTTTTLHNVGSYYYDKQRSQYNSMQMDNKISGVLNAAASASLFKGLLKNSEDISGGQAGMINSALVEKVVADALKEYDLSATTGDIDEARSREMSAALILANIINNPTDDQKLLLDAAESIMKIEEGSQSPELKKASDDLLQMVAAILVAQAIPDLLKEGDVSSIKGIFADLSTQKDKIMLDYQDATKPYYNEIAKELSKSISMLQLKNILSNSMTKEDLENLPPNELDKILEKLRQSKDRSFEEEYILQQDAKYRKAYIDPNKKALEERMKAMMKDFTQKLSGVLEGAQKSKNK